jgi:hypothetical protein
MRLRGRVEGGTTNRLRSPSSAGSGWTHMSSLHLPSPLRPSPTSASPRFLFLHLPSTSASICVHLRFLSLHLPSPLRPSPTSASPRFLPLIGLRTLLSPLTRCLEIGTISRLADREICATVNHLRHGGAFTPQPARLCSMMARILSSRVVLLTKVRPPRSDSPVGRCGSSSTRAVSIRIGVRANW